MTFDEELKNQPIKSGKKQKVNFDSQKEVIR